MCTPPWHRKWERHTAPLHLPLPPIEVQCEHGRVEKHGDVVVCAAWVVLCACVC